MSGPESKQPDDQLLDEFLAEQGAVREAYRAVAREQAPAHLDAAILRAAQEVTARTAPRVLRRRRWQTPMAAAAVMVLSFGVLLQVQRDPAVQQEVMAPLDRAAPAPAPAAPEVMQDVAEAAVLTEATPVRKEAQVEKKTTTAVARPKASPAAEARPPPPPAIAVADAPAPAAVPEAAKAESAAIATESVAPSASGNAAARESTQRSERFAAAPTPMAKASRTPLASKLMSQPAESAPVAGDAAGAAAIEQWAQGCGDESIHLAAPTLWRGLAVASWTRQVGDERVLTTLLFAPQITRQAITVSLGSLAAKATLITPRCTGPATRELRQSEDGWALQCDCAAAE